MITPHQKQPAQAGQLLGCPRYARPHYRVVAGGIESLCRACGGQEVHFHSKQEIMAIWDELERDQQQSTAVHNQARRPA